MLCRARPAASVSESVTALSSELRRLIHTLSSAGKGWADSIEIGKVGTTRVTIATGESVSPPSVSICRSL